MNIKEKIRAYKRIKFIEKLIGRKLFKNEKEILK